MPKQAKAKRDGVINPQNYDFKQFMTENFDALKRYESTEVELNKCRTVLDMQIWPRWLDAFQGHLILTFIDLPLWINTRLAQMTFADVKIWPRWPDAFQHDLIVDLHHVTLGLDLVSRHDLKLCMLSILLQQFNLQQKYTSCHGAAKSIQMKKVHEIPEVYFR